MERTKPFYIGNMLCLCIITMILLISSGFYVQAGSQTFGSPRPNPNVNIDFVNGDFESPDITKDEVSGAQYTLAQSQVELWNYYPAAATGWNVDVIDPADAGSRYAYYMEFHRNGNKHTGGTTSAVDGEQWAELNAAVPTRIYQVCNTTPGTTVFYEFYHRGRNGVDKMNFYLYNYTNQSTGSSTLIRSCSTGTSWQAYRGVYTVPAGQTQTSFAYEATENSDGKLNNGNFLDSIRLYMPAYLELSQTIHTSGSGSNSGVYQKYALINEIVTMEITVTNTGEGETSNTVLTDILPDGVDFINGSVYIEGSAAGSLASYNSSTDTLTIRIGSGAGSVSGGSIAKNESVTVTFDVLVTGNGKTPGNLLENQGHISYTNMNFESEAGTSYNYSNKDGFVLKDCSANGFLWVDIDSNSSYASSERRFSNLAVSLVDASGNVVSDVNGNLLTGNTDGNGHFSFHGIPYGDTSDQYYIRSSAPGYQVSSDTGSGPDDNKAVTHADGGAVIGALDFNASLNSTVLHQITYPDQNIGLVPAVTIEKSASVSGAAQSTGTSDDPVGISETDFVLYTIQITNHASNSLDDVYNITLTDVIPETMLFSLSDVSPLTGLTINGQTAEWSISSLAAGETKTYRIRTFPDNTVLEEAVLINNAFITLEDRARDAVIESNKTYHYRNALPVHFTISKKITAAALTEQSFTFEIAYARDSSSPTEAVYYGVVTIPAGQQNAAIGYDRMPAGFYTIKELTSNMRYTITSAGQQVQELPLTSETSRTGAVTFENEPLSEAWLNAAARVTNKLKNIA